MKKFVLKLCVFFTVFALLLSAVSAVFVYKTVHRAKLIEGLYRRKDVYDVVMMGSSHMNGGVDPNVLWHKYGIAGYNYATGGQPLDVTYYMLKEVLKKHTPKVVVLDVFYAGQQNEYGENGLISNALDNVRFSWNKLEAIWNCTPAGDRVKYLFPVLKYHFRWPELEKKDFYFDTAEFYYTKGFDSGTKRYGKEDRSAAPSENRISIPPKMLDYLNRFTALAREKNFSLVFLNMPADYEVAQEENADWVQDCEALFNSIGDFAQEKGVPFLDYHDRAEEIGIDFPNDMNNSGHLNVWGAYKVSTSLGQYLKQNYSLSDHRGEPEYAQWDEDYKQSLTAAQVKEQ